MVALKRESKATHTERLVIRVSKELSEKFKQAAKENEMSKSAYVRMILRNGMQK